MFFLEVGYKIKKKRRGGMSMRKKMKLFIAMVSVGVLLGTIEVNCKVTKWMYNLIKENLSEKQLNNMKEEYERRYIRHGK